MTPLFTYIFISSILNFYLRYAIALASREADFFLPAIDRGIPNRLAWA
jgi:hypothetical protein